MARRRGRVSETKAYGHQLFRPKKGSEINPLFSDLGCLAVFLSRLVLIEYLHDDFTATDLQVIAHVCFFVNWNGRVFLLLIISFFLHFAMHVNRLIILVFYCSHDEQLPA
jgi:hypothetical protein